MQLKSIISQRVLKKVYSPLLKSKKAKQKSISPLRFQDYSRPKRSESTPRSVMPLTSRFKKESKPEVLQSKSSNIATWKTANGHSASCKVFIIQGLYPDLKETLIQRGWVENKDPTSTFFDFCWAGTAKFPNTLQDWQITNHFPRNVEISAKWNFCENLKKAKNSLKITSIGFFPRCFKYTGRDMNEFEDHFKAIKAASLLKEYIENKQICYEKIVTAIGVCKRWVYYIEKNYNFDRDKPGCIVMQSEWRILNSVSTFEIQVEFKKYFAGKSLVALGEIRDKAEAVLRRLEKIDPQYCLNGKNNIWIVKPGRKSRGRGISLFTSLDQIKKYTQNPQQWIVQKYIENPLLINQKKFDIRQWVLITNSDPLTIWIYNSSYLRFTVENYDEKDIENLYIHLTNNSISKKSDKFSESGIEGCMWSSSQFSDFLLEKYGEDVWGKKLFPRIKEIVKMSLLAVGNLGRKNSFEIFGYDFMVDNELKVWLIEVNSSPSMEYSTVSV